jgi:hypothetical protein
MINQGRETIRAALNTNRRAEAQFVIAEVALLGGDAKGGLAELQTVESSGRMGKTKTFWVQFYRGHFLAMSDAGADVHEAEALLRSCLDTARKGQCKLRELLTATGLARLVARTGRRAEARVILAETYGWFTEGFDTAPLRDAKALLDDLSR